MFRTPEFLGRACAARSTDRTGYGPHRLRSVSEQAQRGKRPATCSQPSLARHASRVPPAGPEGGCLASGPPSVGLHSLRHSAAAVMLVNRVPLRSSPTCWDTRASASPGDIYGHVSPDVSGDAFSRLSAGLWMTKGVRKRCANPSARHRSSRAPKLGRTRCFRSGSKQTRTADPLLVRQVL
jgi:hypothetical protein